MDGTSPCQQGQGRVGRKSPLTGQLRYDCGAGEDHGRAHAAASGHRRSRLRRARSECALAKVEVDVTLIDAYNHHCFQPLLYEVATAALSPADIAWPIRAIVREQKNVRVIMARVTAINIVARSVHTTEIDLRYDYLVLATGATHSYFGHDDWAPFAPGLKHIADATEIRRRFLLAFERAEVVEDEAERARLLTFVIIGGGATGVEIAGAIAEVARQTLQHDFRRIDPRTSRIVLIEAGPRLLPAFPEALSDYARRSLEGMGVEVALNRQVTGCDAQGVALDGGRIEAATVIWAAGVVASPAANGSAPSTIAPDASR